VIRTAPRAILADIDSLPFPILPDGAAWSDGQVPLFLTTSRGCYGHCSFCRSSHFGERWRSRNPKNVVDEIEAAYARGVRIFEMVDDNFLGPGATGKRRAVAIADELRRRGLDIRFHASCRVNDVDEPTMYALREAGLVSVSLGVESGVPRMLKTFNKNVTVAQNLAALELLERLGIPTLAYIIFFDPWSTLAEARENAAFIRRIRALKTVRFEAILFRKLIPISGTDLFARVREAGLLRGDYLSGHRFEFVDERVALLADFLETIDLRFEAALQDERFRAINGMYSLKESLQLDLAEKAIAWLDSARRVPRTARNRLDGLLADELRTRFGPRPGRAEPVRLRSRQGGVYGKKPQAETRVR
jgi:anaerobic magnesium-protoporphyrin IX monomethyl ester cyclase